MRVLVVEDDLRMARVLRRGLAEEGHAVDVAGSGPDGLWLATENPYAAVVLDIMLPGFDGIEVCRRLRASGRWMPVLMLTARDGVGDRVRGLDAGADDYLVKPFSLLELAARLRALARRDGRPRPVLLAESGLRLDPAAKRAWRDGTELRLSPKEFSLLELFLRHPGVVLTRSQIIDAVWDFAYDGASNVVDQYVTYLRRKVDVPFGRHDIETVRGMGYRLRRAERELPMPVRLRLALLFAAALTVVYALGAWLLVSRLGAAVLHTMDTQLSAQVSQAARYLPPDEGGGPRPAATGGLATGTAVVQVIDSSGRVRGTSSGAESGPLLTGRELQQARRVRITVTQTAEDERERLVAGPLAGHPGWVAVAVASLGPADATLGDVTAGLVTGGAAFIMIASLGAYGLARAALSPVERLRREAAAISERDPASRLQVPRTRDEIAALAETMNGLLARLQAALARQRAFVADASHELRTPFAVLGGELELAARPGRSRAELAAAVAATAAEVARLTRLTDDLLLLARGDEDQLSLRREAVGISSLLAQSMPKPGRPGGQAVSCTLAVPDGLAAVVDAGRVRQAVDNLVDNALRFAPAGSQIAVSARADGPDLVIGVSDSGPGFPADFLPHAFERFSRPDSGRARCDGGAGLGLAIVAAIAHAHGGRATAGNRPGGGAVVSIRLPRTVIGAAGEGPPRRGWWGVA